MTSGEVIPKAEFSSRYTAARGGDMASREALVLHFSARLRSFIDRQMGADARRRSEPEDIAQTTFLTFFDRIGGFPEDLLEDEVLAYLLQIGKWKIGDVLRSGMRSHGESWMPAYIPAGQASAGPVTREDERRWTKAEIERLPEIYRGVFRHFYVEGLAVEDVARRLGLSVDAVKQRLNRGRDHLRKKWLGEGDRDDG